MSETFIAEFPLHTTPADEATLAVRLDAARQIYNAVLSESLRRLDLMRESWEWQAARAIKRGKGRTEAFKACQARFAFSYGDIQKYAQQRRDACWIGDHLGSHDMQTTARQAFEAVQRYVFVKDAGRPRFKGKNRLRSVAGKGDAVIRFRWQDDKPIILWAGVSLPLMLDPRDKHGWQAHALQCRTKYVRILRRTVKGRVRWYAQLVQEGVPHLKHPVSNGIVGLDLGPSNIAIVGQDAASFEPFAPSVQDKAKVVRRIQRAMDRSRRATNPECYNANGTIKKGAKIKVRSAGYKNLACTKAEAERRLAETRKQEHGEMANRVLAMGNVIKTEKISYKSFQRNFGRSVQRRAPGLFVSILRRKAASAGAEVMEFSTRTTALSQFDHVTGQYVKKPLSQRWHIFSDGSRVHRDLYSAWLARFVENERLNASLLGDQWAAAEPLLQRAALGLKQSTSRGGLPFLTSKGVRADRTLKTEGRLFEAVEV